MGVPSRPRRRRRGELGKTVVMLAHMRLRQLCLALRARCAELEARVEALESQEMHAAADNFGFSERLAALEELMSTDWMMQGGGSGSGSTD